MKKEVPEKVSNITIEGARIGFRNFSGKEGKFNPSGSRNFVVFLEKGLAERLQKDGWNVRWLEPKDKDEDLQGYLQVKVGFGDYPPKITLITKGISRDRKTNLEEDSVHLLDWAEIENVDLIIRPYHYDVSGKKGIKAYLKTMYVVIIPDVFEEKYREETSPDSAKSSVFEDGLH